MNKDTLSQLVLWGSNELEKKAAGHARFEAEILLAFALNKPRVYLHTWPNANIAEDSHTLYSSLIQRRKTGEPIAYLTGQREFWSLELQINSDVLIPRPETELLVEKALQKISGIPNPVVIDLGTGSGAIALAIASERQDANVTASDFSQAALDVAKQNARQLGIKNVDFMQSHWCQELPLDHYHLIVSNPPYVASEDHHLKGDLRFEPLSALSSGKDGLDDIRLICQTAAPHLLDGGCLYLEHGYDQADAINTILTNENFIGLGHAQDLNQIPRLSWGQKA